MAPFWRRGKKVRKMGFEISLDTKDNIEQLGRQINDMENILMHVVSSDIEITEETMRVFLALNAAEKGTYHKIKSALDSL